MPKCRFVVPSVTTIPPADGDWIQVKNQLTVGEERAAFQQLVGEVNTDGWRRPNMALIGVSEVAAYVVGWSLLDPQGHPMPPDLATIQLLDSESYKEIEAAVQAHIQAKAEALAAEKNAIGGVIDSSPISPSAA